jgi:hypothetical protein
MTRLLICRVVCCTVLLHLLSHTAWCGGPLQVAGPASAHEGHPFRWDTAGPVAYRTDLGPLGKLANSQAVSRVEALFRVWEDVPTASIAFTRAGNITGVSDGDVSSATELDLAFGSCESGAQSPIVFDANGAILQQLGIDPGVVGFAFICKRDDATARIQAAGVVLNGRWIDGSVLNNELTDAEFDAVFIHEFGHFIGLDHSQINRECLGSCTADALQGLPTMFPFLLSDQQRSLAPDDIAWVSTLYPHSSFATAYGTIKGYVLFPDGISHAQGVNVIARAMDDSATPVNESLAVAVSVVSGFRFTGNPGQSVTATYLPCVPASACPSGFAANNVGGSAFGSRNPLFIGYYEMAVPAGTYTVQVETVEFAFQAGSSVGPLDPPVVTGPPEFWNQQESARDDPGAKDAIPVAAGEVIEGVNVILNGTPQRFDQFEDSSAQLYWKEEEIWVWSSRDRNIGTGRIEA